MPKQTATWNTARDAWEKPGAVDLTCGHSAVYSATFPTSGSMRNGVAYELPTWEPATPDTESLSLLRTVMAAEADGGPLSPAMAKHRGQTLRLSGQMIDLVAPNQLKQPTAPDTNMDGQRLLPTPVAQHSGNSPEDHLRKKPGRKVVTDLAVLTENGLLESGGKLLPTPTVGMMMGGSETRSGKRSNEKLLPGVAKELTGGHMPQPSAAGNESLAGQLPGQLSLLDELEQSA